MLGKDEGADPSASNNEDSSNTQQRLSGIAGRVSSDFHSKTYELTHLSEGEFIFEILCFFSGKCNGQETAPCTPWHVS